MGVAATNDLRVALVDMDNSVVSNAMTFIDGLVKRNVTRGRYDDDKADRIMKKITPTSMNALEAFNPNFVIEAITEDFDAKVKLFKQIEPNVGDSTIFATNTSSLSITKLAASCNKPERVIGMHFFNPVPIMPLIEIITGMHTSDQTLTSTMDLSEKMGKTITRSKDVPGFIANRVLMPYINEAFLVLGEGTATKEDIDTTMKLGTNVPMGPLTLADFIGLDTCLAIMEVLHTGFGDSKYRPAPLLRKYVEAGFHGRKSKRGVYDYRK